MGQPQPLLSLPRPVPWPNPRLSLLLAPRSPNVRPSSCVPSVSSPPPRPHVPSHAPFSPRPPRRSYICSLFILLQASSRVSTPLLRDPLPVVVDPLPGTVFAVPDGLLVRLIGVFESPSHPNSNVLRLFLQQFRPRVHPTSQQLFSALRAPSPFRTTRACHRHCSPLGASLRLPLVQPCTSPPSAPLLSVRTTQHLHPGFLSLSSLLGPLTCPLPCRVLFPCPRSSP